jgi:hypothetical protein
VGRTDIEDALQRLEQVTVEEARMAAAESLKATHGVNSNVQGMLQAMEDRIISSIGMLQGVDDRRQGVDDRVNDVGNKAIYSARTATVPLPDTVLIVYTIRFRANRTTNSAQL